MSKIRIFPHFPLFSHIFPQFCFIFFLNLAFRVGDSPTREGPGYATVERSKLKRLAQGHNTQPARGLNSKPWGHESEALPLSYACLKYILALETWAYFKKEVNSYLPILTSMNWHYPRSDSCCWCHGLLKKVWKSSIYFGKKKKNQADTVYLGRQGCTIFC